MLIGFLAQIDWDKWRPENLFVLDTCSCHLKELLTSSGPHVLPATCREEASLRNLISSHVYWPRLAA